MSLLGEISKNSEALRYHAKTAEIAGQNLAHVNDETYARQKVLAREGVMYGSFGELQTSGLEAAGLEHARSELLDKRVVNELSETASLEAQQEILSLLQGALGETITRNGINVGLDDLHDSDLAPGSLTRALNDFFNAFQELSASPDEPTIKQELFNKVGTLVKRFNDAGSSLDSIEEDLSETVKRSVDDVNRVLAQLHETNKQVRRFELQDKGKAVTYRDKRQALLEELSQLMDFKVEEDVVDGKPSGFLNLYVQGTANEKVNLLDPMGPKNITNDWGQEFVIAAPSDPNGKAAKVRAKIDANGNLGRFEVLDGGSLYNDSEGPILVSLLPPKPTSNLVEAQSDQINALPDYTYQIGNGSPVDNGGGTADKPGGNIDNEDESKVVTPLEKDRKAGEIFKQDGKSYITLVDSEKDDNLSDTDKFRPVELDSGEFSFIQDIARKEGDVFYQGDSYYQALTNTQKGDDVSDTRKFMKISTSPNGQVQEIKKRHSDIETFQQGDQIYYEGKFLQATEEIAPVTTIDDKTETAQRTYLAGEVIKFGAKYFQAYDNLNKGDSLVELESADLKGESYLSSLYYIGEKLPNTLDSGKAVEKGDIYNDEGSFYLLINDPEQNGQIKISDTQTYLKLNAVVKDLNPIPEDGQFDDNQIYYHEDTKQHFIVDSAPDAIGDMKTFDPSSAEWASNFHVFNPKLVDDTDPSKILKSVSASGHNLGNGTLQEVNIGVAEAVVKNGEITTFNILNAGNSFPSSDAIFSDGIELDLSAGAIHGYQSARANEMERFRTSLNDLVADFVTQVNKIYNPDDEQGGYLFQFDAFLTNPVMQTNSIMEEAGFFGEEGNGTMTLFREEVDMKLPFPESDTFSLTTSSPFLPLSQDDTPEGYKSRDIATEGDYEFYASATNMKYTTLELDSSFAGDDGISGTDDDGRSLLIAHTDIPFRLESGEKPFLLGDTFSFDAVLQNDWNLATSLKVDTDLTAENLKSTHDFAEGANEVAFKIADLANDGEFTDHISTMNADIGNSLADLNDNHAHQKSLETLLLNQRRAVSSVSIDEEVSDLMQFQRSFQASARVLNTLDKMLELVVMGLVK